MDRKFFPELRLTGTFLILSSVIFLVAATFFTIRFIWELPVANTPAFFLWERSLVIAALLAALHYMYYPWLHYVAPLLIGIALLQKR